MKLTITKKQFKNSWFTKLFEEKPFLTERITSAGTMPLTELANNLWHALTANLNSYENFSDRGEDYVEVTEYLHALQKYVGSAKYVEASEDKDVDEKIELRRKESVLSLRGSTSTSSLLSSASNLDDSKRIKQNVTTPLVAHWKTKNSEKLKKELETLLVIYGGARAVIAESNNYYSKNKLRFMELVDKISGHNGVVANGLLTKEIGRVDGKTDKIRTVLEKLIQAEVVLARAEKRFGLKIELADDIKEVKIEEVEKYVKGDLEKTLQEEVAHSSIKGPELTRHLGMVRFYIVSLKDQIRQINQESALLVGYSQRLSELTKMIQEIKIIDSETQIQDLQTLLDDSEAVYKKIDKAWGKKEYEMAVATDEIKRGKKAIAHESTVKTKSSEKLKEQTATNWEEMFLEAGFSKGTNKIVQLYKNLNSVLTEMMLALESFGESLSPDEKNIDIMTKKIDYYADKVYNMIGTSYRKLHLQKTIEAGKFKQIIQQTADEHWNNQSGSSALTALESLSGFLVGSKDKMETSFDRESIPFFFQFQLKILISLSDSVKEYQQSASQVNVTPVETDYFQPFSNLNYERYELCGFPAGSGTQNVEPGKLYVKRANKYNEMEFVIQTSAGPVNGTITEQELLVDFPKPFRIEELQPHLSKILQIIATRTGHAVKRNIRLGEDENIQEFKKERAELLSKIADSKHPCASLCIKVRSQYMMAVYKQLQLHWIISRDAQARSTSESEFKLSFKKFEPLFVE
ncbi:MAG: hypothetical protein JSR33_07425, partial [Proteobacteria bacterium]|nr:hypothetical protein [Pseudomonadota bacterium]